MAIALLNLDDSLPVADPYNSTNTAGTIRFITEADPRTIAVMNRLQGDLVHRFTLVEGKVNELITVLGSNPASEAFNDAPYSLVNGSRPFTGPVSVPTPTQSAHATPRSYVDNRVAIVQNVLDGLANAVEAFEGVTPRASAWVTMPWTPGVQRVIDLPLASAVANPDQVIAISLLQKLNVGTLSVPVYKYKQLMHGTLGGMAGTGIAGSPVGDGHHIDDYWLQTSALVRVLVPSMSSYGTWTGADYNLAGAVQMWLKAVVFEETSSSSSSAPVSQTVRQLWLPNVTGLTGGGTNLDAIPTAAMPPGTRVDLALPGLQSYVLQSGAANTSAGDVAPLDYNPSTNNVKWVSIA